MKSVMYMYVVTAKYNNAKSMHAMWSAYMIKIWLINAFKTQLENFILRY
jgi:hypothetical protein